MYEHPTSSAAIGTVEYGAHFWNALRGGAYDATRIETGRIIGIDTYLLPDGSNGKFMATLKREGLFRRAATVINANSGSFKILAKDSDDTADWVAEGDNIPIYDGMEDFKVNPIDSHKLACFLKFDEVFVHDASFDFEDYLLRRFAKAIGRAEDAAFINGDGAKMPTGILCPGKGAEIALTTDTVTYDNVVKLFFSLKPEYRDNALWLMNDETAFSLRTLKDGAGNYLWNNADNTILGRPVIVSNAIPSAKPGAVPIVFGDLSYYWVVCRRPVSVRALYERFAAYSQIGYLAIEFLDGRLVRREAVKALQMTV